MAVTHLEVTRRSAYAFDYERVDGVLHFAVDPSDPANARIVDLDKAPRDAQGRVRFEADFLLLRPADPSRANGRLLYYVVNRGKRDSVPFNIAPSRNGTLPPADEIDPGDGFMMKHGWTVAMCGWQWDVERQPGLLGLDAPQALGPDGQPIQGPVVIAFQPNEMQSYHRLAHWPLYPPPGRQAIQHQPYPAADVNEASAVLSISDFRQGPFVPLPRERWRFARDEHGRPIADDSHVWLDGGFQPGKWYEVTYTTRICPVVGTGLLATRDCVAWLRHESPYAETIDYTYGMGRSQCGRFLRQYIYDGLNLDEQGRQVFDGLIPHVAGARRGEFNVRHAQPSETTPRGVGGLFPFTADDQPDPLTGQSDGLLRRQRELGGVPKIFTTNTSSEYWRADCSLIHSDTGGTRDVEPPAEERIYMLAGHEHGWGKAQLNDTNDIGARGANNFNVVDGSTAFRAFLINLDRWVSEGIEPPPSAFPRLADQTAITREAALEWFSRVPGLALADVARLPRLRGLVRSAVSPRGVVETDHTYPSYVSALDGDGNELAGIRLPDLTVPVAVNTGWVPRHPDTGGEGQLLDMMGTTWPLPDVAERYRDRGDYVQKARAAAEALARAHYILEEDIDVVVELAAKRYDIFAPAMSMR